MKESIKKGLKKYFKYSLTATVITWSAAIYFAVTPYKVNTYQLTNGNKTIIFQEMVHVGEGSYYKEVNNKIEDYRSQGFVLYYELIKINNPEELAEMKKLIGINSNVFTDILNKSKLDVQQNYMPKSLKEDVHADIDSKELVTRLKAYYVNNQTKESYKDNLQIDDLFIFGSVDNDYLVRCFLRLGLKVNSLLRLDPVNANDVIIKQRNDVLISKIYNGGDDKIFIQYGAFHFDDFAEQMKKQGYTIEKIDTIDVF